METKYEPVYIKIHFWKFIKSSLVAWGFIIAVLFIMQYGDFFMNGRFKYIGILVVYVLGSTIIIIFIPPALWSLWRIFYIKKPLLVITKEGFTDCSSYVSCGFIAWKEIKNINRQAPSPPMTPLGQYQESLNIMVKVKNLKKILQAIPFIRRKIIETDMRFLLMNDFRFCIALGIAKCSLPEVLQTMQEYKAEYDRLHKAKKLNNDASNNSKYT